MNPGRGHEFLCIITLHERRKSLVDSFGAPNDVDKHRLVDQLFGNLPSGNLYDDDFPDHGHSVDYDHNDDNDHGSGGDAEADCLASERFKLAKFP